MPVYRLGSKEYQWTAISSPYYPDSLIIVVDGKVLGEVGNWASARSIALSIRDGLFRDPLRDADEADTVYLLDLFKRYGIERLSEACALCGEHVPVPHNGAPVVDGHVCTRCNHRKVIPERLRRLVIK